MMSRLGHRRLLSGRARAVHENQLEFSDLQLVTVGQLTIVGTFAVDIGPVERTDVADPNSEPPPGALLHAGATP